MSRAPVAQSSVVDQKLTEVDAYVNMIVSTLPATDVMIQDIKSSQASDATYQKIVFTSWMASQKPRPC